LAAFQPQPFQISDRTARLSWATSNTV
jgi:hypothetical protein